MQRLLSRLVRLLPLLATLFFVIGDSAARADFLHQNGTALVDNAGNPILLRSVNLGTWLYPELWMMDGPDVSAYPGVDDLEAYTAALRDVLDGDAVRTEQVLNAWRDNHVTRADIDALQSWGFNCVRVPLHYELFYDPATGQEIDTGFLYLDRLLTWCAADGIYVIPDMHGVPGGKFYLRNWWSTNPADIIPGNVYTDPINNALLHRIWRRIAARYADNPWIGGYDLLNEPVVADPYNWVLRNFFSDLRDTIRSVDTNHFLVVEGDIWASSLDAINRNDRPWTDTNVLYSDHRYGNGLPLDTASKRICVARNVPLWTGEFGFNSNHWNNTVIANCEQADTFTVGGRTATVQASWGYWSYKSPQFYVLVAHLVPAGFGRLKAYWASPATVPKPSATDAYTWLMQYAQATNYANCTVHKDVVDGLTRTHADYVSRRVPYRDGMTLPGRIYTIDYDMGAEGIAYHDTVSTDEANRGPGGRAWNSGWWGRNDGVDTTSCSDPGIGLKVGWNDPGEWQRYTIESTPGTYKLLFRYSGGAAGAQLHVLVNGVNVSGPVNLPPTGGYGNYATYTVDNVSVSATGPATLEIGCDRAGYDLYWLAFQETRPATVSGRVTLQGSVNSIQPITFVFRPTDGSSSFTRMATLDANGDFSLPDVPRRSYTIWIKGAKWLAKVVAVDTSAGDVTGVTATLLAGDVNNDNVVSTADYLLLKAAFGSVPGDPNWNDGAADLNGDGVVSTADYLLLKQNFGRTGDP